MNNKFSKLVINDLFDEMRDENNRLLTQLLFTQKCVQLLENYRKYLIVFNNNCICSENIGNKLIVSQLENEYKCVFNSDINNKSVDKNNNKNKKQNINKRKINTFYALIDEKIVIKTENDSKDGIIEDTNALNNNNIHENTENSLTDSESSVENIEDSNELRTELEMHLNKCEFRFNSHTINGLTNSTKNRDFIDKRFECIECDKKFNSKNKLCKHKRLIHSNKCRIYSCDWNDCKFVTKYGENLEKHKRRVHLGIEDKPYKCSDCDKRFQSKTLLTSHINAEHKGIRYECDVIECRFKSKSIYTLRKHRLRKHCGDKPFACEWPGCEARYLLNHELRNHQNRVHTNEKQFKCVWPQCDQSFNSSNVLESHVNKVHTNERPFRCDKCDKRYAALSLLNSHIRRSHRQSGVEYKCEHCDYSAKGGQHLKVHVMRKHSKEKPFKCEWNECQSSFVTKFELQEHHKCMHSNERPFKCLWPACEATFKFKQNLTLHSRSHTGEKPFGCDWPECEKRFRSKSDLKVHLLMHERKH